MTPPAPIHLTRGLRLTLNPRSRTLTFGHPDTLDLHARPLTLWLTFTGPINPQLGLLINVTDINQAFRRHLPLTSLPDSPLDILTWARTLCRDQLPDLNLAALSLELSPSLTFTLIPEDDMIRLTTRYELAASHRLWNPDASDEYNRRQFGKCANPAGHGHNYDLEVTIQGPQHASTPCLSNPDIVHRIVHEIIIDRFDHKNLNTDTPEFQHLIPTVENMAVVFYDLLAGRFDDAELYRIAVWETPRTCAEYFGPHAGPLRPSRNT